MSIRSNLTLLKINIKEGLFISLKTNVNNTKVINDENTIIRSNKFHLFLINLNILTQCKCNLLYY